MLGAMDDDISYDWFFFIHHGTEIVSEVDWEGNDQGTIVDMQDNLGNQLIFNPG